HGEEKFIEGASTQLGGWWRGGSSRMRKCALPSLRWSLEVEGQHESSRARVFVEGLLQSRVDDAKNFSVCSVHIARVLSFRDESLKPGTARFRIRELPPLVGPRTSC